MGRGTCEAGGRIKPGAQAPGSFQVDFCEPMKWATALPAVRGLNVDFHIDPGAYAPGFILPPASQVPRPHTWAARIAG
jgi:hypothetical protein